MEEENHKEFDYDDIYEEIDRLAQEYCEFFGEDIDQEISEQVHQ